MPVCPKSLKPKKYKTFPHNGITKLTAAPSVLFLSIFNKVYNLIKIDIGYTVFQQEELRIFSTPIFL